MSDVFVGRFSEEAAMRRWDGLVDRYVKECEARGLAESTVHKRSRELERFGAWLKRQRPRRRLEDVDADLVVRYVQGRTAFHARCTVAGVVTDLRGMGEFLVRDGIWHSSPLRWMKGPKIDPRSQVPRRISREQQTKMWAAASRHRTEYARYQAVCTLALLYATGLRRGELERLDVADWDRDAGLLRIDGKKTGQARRVPVGESAWRCIEAYLPHRHNLLEKRGNVVETALLVGRNGRRMTGAMISGLVKRLTDSAGIEKVTLHQFRHSCASDLLESGASLPEVQRVLGHAVIESTVRYVQLADPQRSAAIAKHPINELIEFGARRAS
jgi:site-specific recombinase XerD